MLSRVRRASYSCLVTFAALAITTTSAVTFGNQTASGHGTVVAHPRPVAILRSTVASIGFGDSVSVSGSNAIVGAHEEGSAFIFHRTGAHWHQLASFKDSAYGTAPYFGSAVAISGNVAIIGEENRMANTGRAFIYSLHEGSWRLSAVFTHNRGFGYSVAVDGGTAVVGSAGGNAYVYEHMSKGWVQEAVLRESYVGRDGTVVAVSSGNIVVGEAMTNPAGEGRALPEQFVYIYHDDGHGWRRAAVFSGTGQFGSQVAIWGGNVLVGADDQNIVYDYEHTSAGWRPSAPIHAPKPYLGFGAGVAVYKRTAVISALSYTTGGSVYVFTMKQAVWRASAKFSPVNGDDFGSAVDVSGGTIIVGAPATAGRAYLFDT